MSTPSDSNTMLPLRPALRTGTDTEDAASPKSGPVKVVSIAEPSESPLPPTPTEQDPTRIKQFNAGVAAKRLTGRPSMPSHSSRLSLISQSSLDDAKSPSETVPRETVGKHHQLHHHHHEQHQNRLLTQVAEWLQAEKGKRAARKSKKKGGKESKRPEEETSTLFLGRPRTASQGSDSSAISLEKLQRILEENMGSFGLDRLPGPSPTIRPMMSRSTRRRSSTRKLGGGASSDTEYQDGDVVVPSCDVVLDNSKTMSYSGGGAESSSETPTLSTSRRVDKERKAWLSFKTDIVTLAHTLRLKGWRKVPIESGGDIEVERLSGALTNAVYVVSPPNDLPAPPSSDTSSKVRSTKPPPKLLLRVYGPQVEHLIDRENELGILRRLARKKIGPRLLGTFRNGRFEEFFNAQTLTADDLRDENTSKQIAKRMRELHEGIDLLEREREEGPFVWRNWDKWVDRCEEVISYLDKQILEGHRGSIGKRDAWKTRGLVCGVEWKVFKSAVDQYRKWMYEYYAIRGGVSGKLVFAHNDTQYGNILRLVPDNSGSSAPSPLLLPQNTHKQLVVIDFEYASANTPGLEFANHFTEWCYNYHDPQKPWFCNTARYPTLEEQKRFIRSYVNHRPQFNPRASATPKMNAMDGLAKGSLGEFLLDSRTPGGMGTPAAAAGSSTSLLLGDSAVGYAEEEAAREKHTERQVEELLQEARIWRVANSAQWVAWGIVQAKVPELDAALSKSRSNEDGVMEPLIDDAVTTTSPPPLDDGDAAHFLAGEKHLTLDKRPPGLVAEALRAGEDKTEVAELEKEVETGTEVELEEEDEFDYIRYAQERAMFFWGDLVSLGMVKREELPRLVGERLKLVEY